MGPNKGGQPNRCISQMRSTAHLVRSINSTWSTMPVQRFGSGWAWLVLSDGKLVVSSTPNQDNPLMDVADVKVILYLELMFGNMHILHYQNRRPDYLNALVECC